jgi:hypothetical protein
MDNNKSSADELKAIRKLMEESTRFLSLSGLSGIVAGSFALAGALIAHFLILKSDTVNYGEYFRNLPGSESQALRMNLVIDALCVLILSVTTSVYFSARKARKAGKGIWTPVSKRLLINMMIPLLTGGILSFILILQNDSHLVIPVLLIFYGLSLVNAGKFTYGEVFYLGTCEIITGLAAVLLPGFGLLFWIIGFGILHIVYGVSMYRKYEV